MTTNATEPDVVAADGCCLAYSQARTAWENGEFSDWVAGHGFPLTIDGDVFESWDGVEDALSGDQWDEGCHN